MLINIGPEWVWIKGYYEMAKLEFDGQVGIENEFDVVPFYEELLKNKYRGLPELTNENGIYCRDSCSTQAWSAATYLEYFYRKANLVNK